jgi:hypothetical protein
MENTTRNPAAIINMMKFIWIDDDPQREPTAVNLGERLNVSVVFRSVKGQDVQSVLFDIISSEMPDLVILDHSLDKAASETFKNGFISAAFLRNKWQDCPIVCVTAIDREDFDTEQHSLYQETYEWSKISESDGEILSIANSFKTIRKLEIKNIDQILDLMGCPEDDKSKVAAVLPQEIKEFLKDKSLPIHLGRWIIRVLYNRPGFLYDTLWCATTIGLNERGFSKVEKLFKPALYMGIFNNEHTPRWWKSELLTILYATAKSNGLPWVIGRSLPGITSDDYSIDYIDERSDPIPETVAFIDQSQNSKQVAIRIQDTEIHPNYEDMLFFETIRIMKARDNGE